ncbi:hypothetical protein TNCT_575971 [Trichonephila clavata]|uniref:Uncharacterized protein n=1 Tax=Trichonephila clavata TaxID=2740835 RepID=A0A8X6H7M7_TRICU|nr:hypothetical protein TNCT_575971 [Trichonephila clavata]
MRPQSMLTFKKNDAFYKVTTFKRFNDANLQLEGTNKTLICCRSIVLLFIDKLFYLLERESHQFSELSFTKNEIPKGTDRFSIHFKELELDMGK